MRKLTLKGFRTAGKLNIALPKRYVVDIPPFFIIEIDMGKIKAREKEHNKSRRSLK